MVENGKARPVVIPANAEESTKLAESKSYEASVTYEKNGTFWIVGKDEVAEVYGVCRTLEDQLGIRWFKAWEPDDPGDFVPKTDKVVLDGKLTLRAPYFQKRRLDMTGSSCAYIPYKGVEWGYRAGLQAWPQGGGGHMMLCEPIPAKTYFKDHPEYFAEEVLKAYPDTDALTDWVYSIYGITPPKDVKHDPRMGAQFCVMGRCYGHHLDDPKCPINRERYAWLKGWMNVLSHGYTYEYAKCSNCSYSPYDLAFASDIKLYVKLGLSGWKEEMCFVDSVPPSRFPSKDKEAVRRRAETAPSVWQWFYLASRLTWDPTLDAQAILDEIEAKYYGAAYPAMRKCHALRRKTWDESKVCMGWPRGNGRRPTLLNAPGVKEELLGYLDEAERLIEEVKDEGEGEQPDRLAVAARLGKEVIA